MAIRLRTHLVYAGSKIAADLRPAFKDSKNISTARIDRFLQLRDCPFDLVVFDLETLPIERLEEIAKWRRTAIGQSIATIFVVDAQSRSKLLALGATRGANLIRRPLGEQDIPGLLKLLAQTVEDNASALALARQVKEYHQQFPAYSEALVACDGVLDDIFQTFPKSGKLDTRDIAQRSTMMIDSLEETGLPAWIAAVRTHHDVTYQHCLLVTGTLLAFGHHLKMNKPDLQRLAVGGLLHDLGKADVPLAILDKPASLTEDELVIVRQHPLSGVERLKKMVGTTPELISFVRDHHEYLDGSGYPHGLLAENISDPVRLLTIADIFSALMERRSYKPEMKAEQAFEIMAAMHGKIDQEILSAVKSVMLNVRP